MSENMRWIREGAVLEGCTFFSLLAKVLPLQVTGEGNVKTISRIEIVPVKSKEPQSEKRDLEACP
ncbi:Uncharacterised protein [Bartonella elizabethae]|nr:Uncharacterised protein [Bartonella elizabethae]